MSLPHIIATTIGAVALGVCLTAPASASHWRNDHEDTRPLADWEVFGFDISSVPDDPASLAAFRASLDPRTQRGITDRCRYDIGGNPMRYSPKVRMFCWGH